MKGHSNCIGCKINTPQEENNISFEECTLQPINRKGVECPCCTCLIKTMCKDSCLPYRKFKKRDEIYNEMEGDNG